MMQLFGLQIPQELADKIESVRYGLARIAEHARRVMENISTVKRSYKSSLIKNSLEVRTAIITFLEAYNEVANTLLIGFRLEPRTKGVPKS
ncbi:unnamed protein product [Protopolystoma xenopodis]|uniref:Uncharacterized protein n=1 Tax=Protopolystoma xenopodis TaxID=117903 RepID=A0A448WM46_9PLAT|nr:unnamed protein product [Protopolystoma xenopodis]